MTRRPTNFYESVECAVDAIQCGEEVQISSGFDGKLYVVGIVGIGLVAIKEQTRRGSLDHELRNVPFASMANGACVKYLPPVVHNDRPYLPIEYVPGGDLFTWILEAPNELAQNWKIARNLLSTYAKFAGPFLAHGDLKSENILVYNRELDVRFIDLGHAWPREGDEKLRTVLGCSPATTAPEIFASFSNVDVAKADIWSLGVVLFEIFTRLGPWGYADMSDPLYAYFRQCGKFAPGFAIDADVADLVAGCFAEDPAERPTVAELIQKAGPN